MTFTNLRDAKKMQTSIELLKLYYVKLEKRSSCEALYISKSFISL